MQILHCLVNMWKFKFLCVSAVFLFIFINLQCLAQDRNHWYQQAKSQLMNNLKGVDNTAIARNVILFIGDGMGLTTVTTARIFKGQRRGQTGEENDLIFDKFQHVALAKTYNTDSQVGDSGACATALLCGVKGKSETVGLDNNGVYNNCETSLPSRVDCLADWAQAEEKSTGFVTTTRVTHATPAAFYAYSASRYWENDAKVPSISKRLCKDIARQLVEEDPGKNINVILGGGRSNFVPMNQKSDRYHPGKREDSRNLIDVWKFDKKNRKLKNKYVSNAKDMQKIDPTKIDYLLGLFSSGHMTFDSDREDNDEMEPSLSDMTKKAIQILQKNPNGFLLMVEGGRIDHSHHDNNAHRALTETLAFEKAITTAIQMTRNDDTLIVVTSDHSHVFAFGGYPKRGNPILGLDNKLSDVDNMPYTTLTYSNGPGYNRNFPNGRENLSAINTGDRNYTQQSAVPRRYATHSGEDVPVYAHGSMSHLFRGVVEQTYIPHAIAYAACIGPQKNDCEQRKRLYNHRRLVQCPEAHTDDSASNSAKSCAQKIILPIILLNTLWRT